MTPYRHPPKESLVPTTLASPSITDRVLAVLTNPCVLGGLTGIAVQIAYFTGTRHGAEEVRLRIQERMESIPSAALATSPSCRERASRLDSHSILVCDPGQRIDTEGGLTLCRCQEKPRDYSQELAEMEETTKRMQWVAEQHYQRECFVPLGWPRPVQRVGPNQH